MPDRLVSVVIPVRNREEPLLRAVDSVRAQTYGEWEVVVVDDGSTDRTWEVLQDIIKTDPRVRGIRHEVSLGAQAARNTGIRASKGHWVAFLDSDDEFLPDSLSLRLHAASEAHVEVVHSEAWQDDAGRSELHLFQVPPYAGAIYGSVLRHPGPMYPALMVTRVALAQIGGLDEKLVSYQEWDTSIRLAKRNRFAFVPEPTFIYHCTGSDTISKQVMGAVLGYEQVFRKHRLQILLHAGPRAVARHHEILIRLFREAGHPERGKRYQPLVTLVALIRRALP